MVHEPEDGGTALGRVAADALEDSGAVVQAVRADVDPGVRPVHQLAVHPDLLGLLHRPPLFPRCYVSSATSTNSARATRTSSDAGSPAMCLGDPAPTHSVPSTGIRRSSRMRETRASATGATAPTS